MRKLLGHLVHYLSDELRLVAHWLIADPEWRQRNG
jgi:hypothetical protein